MNDLTLSSLVITLTSQNNGLCNSVSDNITVFITQKPFVDAGKNDTICASAGIIYYYRNSEWICFNRSMDNNGLGSFNNPGALSIFYQSSVADTLAGSVQLILTSTGG